MSPDNKILATIIVALTGVTPSPGEDCILATADFEAIGRLIFVEIDGVSRSPDSLSPAGHLAAIVIALSLSAVGKLTQVGQACQIELRNPATRELIAAGLTVESMPELPRPYDISSLDGGVTIWLTGLSGADKSTIATELHHQLVGRSRVELLDGDAIRTHICNGLGFTREDSDENVRRLALTSRTFANTGAIVIVSPISPYCDARDQARQMIGRFIEVYVNAPLAIYEERDVNGLYKRARRGKLRRFTGIDDPHERPLHPEIECCTDFESVDESVTKILAAINREVHPSSETVTVPCGRR